MFKKLTEKYIDHLMDRIVELEAMIDLTYDLIELTLPLHFADDLLLCERAMVARCDEYYIQLSRPTLFAITWKLCGSLSVDAQFVARNSEKPIKGSLVQLSKSRFVLCVAPTKAAPLGAVEVIDGTFDEVVTSVHTRYKKLTLGIL